MKRYVVYVNKFMWMSLLFSFFSCRKENSCDCFKSTGNERTEGRNISGFTKISLYNNVDLVLIPGKPYACSVTAGSNLIDMVTTEVDGQTLTIRNKNKCNWVRSFKNKFTVEVSMPSIDYIYFTGSGTITCKDTIRENIFSMDGWTCSGSVNLVFNSATTRLTLHTGTADLKASGFSGVSYVYNSGAGPMDCSQMQSGYTYITNASTNDCFVNVSKELGAKIMLQGDVYYAGTPYKIEKEISGKGNLIHL